MTYLQTEKEGLAKQTWHQAVYCKDFYADRIADENKPDFKGQKFFSDEFSDTETEWICPNITEIDVWNDPYNYR